MCFLLVSPRKYLLYRYIDIDRYTKSDAEGFAIKRESSYIYIYICYTYIDIYTHIHIHRLIHRLI